MDAHAALADDYRWWEAPLPVSVAVKKAGGTTTIAVASAVRGFRSAARLVRQLFGPLSSTAGREMFVIPDALLHGETIKIGDAITDPGGVVWSVDEVAPLKARTQWACLCTQQR